MALTPPPDYTRVFLFLAIGVCLVALVLVYSRSTLPTVGDPWHNLPHGGFYKDGTKQIYYGAPSKLNSLESRYRFVHQPWAYVLGLSILIATIHIYESSRVCRCGRVH